MTRALVMAKAPVPGTVKTRLRLPPETVARLQEAFIVDTVSRARAAIGPVTVTGSPPEKSHLIKRLLPRGDTRLVPQVDGDLGERMLAAAREMFSRSPEPVVILGTDAPTLPRDRLQKAVLALEDHDAAIVPSEDGGYVLLGLRAPYEALFSGIPWSTDTVYRRTLEKARDAGLSLLSLESWYDVDDPEDLDRLSRELSGSPDTAPRTAAVLRKLGRI